MYVTRYRNHFNNYRHDKEGQLSRPKLNDFFRRKPTGQIMLAFYKKWPIAAEDRGPFAFDAKGKAQAG